MKINRNLSKYLAIYAVALGVLYTIIGFAEFTTAFWNWFIKPGDNLSLLGLPSNDLFGGFAALVIGFTFFGAIPLWKARYEYIGFILVGTLLSVTFGAIYLFCVVANGFETLLAYLSGEAWTWEWLVTGKLEVGLFRPEIWLAFSSTPIGYIALKVTKRDKKV